MVKADIKTAREALALAQNDAEEARRLRDEARRAQSLAFGRLVDAQDRLENLKAETEAQEKRERLLIDTQEIGRYRDAVISALAAGDDVLAVANPKAERAARIKEAEGEIESWRKARSIAEEEANFREQVLKQRLEKVDGAASRVIAAGVDVDALVSEAEALEKALVERRLLMGFLSRHVGEADHARINAFRKRPLSALDSVDAWRSAPVTEAWRQAHTALTRDANAPLPK